MSKKTNNQEAPLLQKHSVICRFSQLPRKGLLADFSKIGLNQLVEFSTNDFYDLIIFEMQFEHIKQRAKDLNSEIVVYHMGGNNISMSDNYMIKFTQNGI